MKRKINIPKYLSSSFSIRFISVEDNTLCIRGNYSDEDYNLGMWHDTNGFSFVCNDAETLAYLLRTDVSHLADFIRFEIKGHVDILEQYCKQHGLPCTLKTDEEEMD